MTERSEKQSVMLDLFTRPGPRAPLNRMICWHAELSNARAWSLIEQVRAILTRYNVEGYTQDDVTMQHELDHPTNASKEPTP